MSKVVDFFALVLGIRTANNTENYRLSRCINGYAFRSYLKWVLLVVVGGTILFFLIGLLTSTYTKKRNTTQKLNKLGSVIVNYHQTQKQLPSNLEEVIANSPLRRNLTTDSWGNPILYRQDLPNKTFSLYSAGPDQRLNTSDDLVLVNPVVE